MSSLEPVKPSAFDANYPPAAAESTQDLSMTMSDTSFAAVNALSDAAESPGSQPSTPIRPRSGDGSSCFSSSSRDTTPTPCSSGLPWSTQLISISTFCVKASVPALTSELVELVIGFSLRMLPDKFYLPGNPTLTHPLNVLSRSAMPTPTKVALMHLPTVTLNSAGVCAVEGHDVAQLLNMMVHLSMPPYRRPLAYNGSYLLTSAARTGSLAVLQWWMDHKDSVPLVCNTEAVVDVALRNGHLHVLDWCVMHGLSLPTEDLSSLWSSTNVDVLTWCLENGLAPEYDDDPVENACETGAVRVLDWWLASGLPFKYSHYALLAAISEQHTQVLEWWSNSGLMLYGDELELSRTAIQCGDIFALEWLATNNMLLVHSTLLRDVFAVEDVNVIQWCMDRFKMRPSSLGVMVEVWTAASKHASTLTLDLAESLGFEVPSDALVSPCLETAAGLGLLPILDWWLWKIPTLAAVHFESALIAATTRGHVAVLDWIKHHGYFQQDRPDMPSITKAAAAGHVDVIDWFARHPKCGCGNRSHHEFPAAVYLAAAENGHVAIVDWWRKNTLTVPAFVQPSTSGRQPIVPACTASRQAFVAAAKRGHGAVLKSWVDATRSKSIEPLDVPAKLVEEVLFALAQHPSGVPVSYVKWWATLTGCRSHSWCADLVTFACANNRVDLLDWMRDSHLFDAEHVYNGVHGASERGNIQVLDWWAAHTDEIKTAFNPFDCFGVDTKSVHCACHWWAHNASSLSLEACELPASLLNVVGAVTLIDRMLRLGVFTVPTSFSVYDEVSSFGRPDVLSWWYSTDLVPKKSKRYSKEALLEASVASHINVLNWWRMMSVAGPCTSVGGVLRLKIPFRSLDDMIGRGDVGPAAVEWWIESGLLPETAPGVDQDDGQGDEDDNEDEDGDEDDDDDDDDDGDGDNDDEVNELVPVVIEDIEL